METKNPMLDWMNANGLVVRICDGAITICDGDCENCESEDEDDG